MTRQDWWAPDNTSSPAERVWINTANQIAQRKALAAQKRRPDADEITPHRPGPRTASAELGPAKTTNGPRVYGGR